MDYEYTKWYRLNTGQTGFTLERGSVLILFKTCALVFDPFFLKQQTTLSYWAINKLRGHDLFCASREQSPEGEEVLAWQQWTMHETADVWARYSEAKNRPYELLRADSFRVSDYVHSPGLFTEHLKELASYGINTDLLRTDL